MVNHVCVQMWVYSMVSCVCDQMWVRDMANYECVCLSTFEYVVSSVVCVSTCMCGQRDIDTHILLCACHHCMRVVLGLWFWTLADTFPVSPASERHERSSIPAACWVLV